MSKKQQEEEQKPEQQADVQAKNKSWWGRRSFFTKLAIGTVLVAGIVAATFATLGAAGVGIGAAGAASAVGSWFAGAASSVWAGVTSFGIGSTIGSAIVGGLTLAAAALGIGVAGNKINKVLDSDQPRKKAVKGAKAVEKYVGKELAQQEGLSGDEREALTHKKDTVHNLKLAIKKGNITSAVLHEDIEGNKSHLQQQTSI